MIQNTSLWKKKNLSGPRDLMETSSHLRHKLAGQIVEHLKYVFIVNRVRNMETMKQRTIAYSINGVKDEIHWPEVTN